MLNERAAPPPVNFRLPKVLHPVAPGPPNGVFSVGV